VVKHKVWNAGWEAGVERLWSDLQYTLRRLGRMPGLVAVVVLSIGIGVAANATIFSIVNKFLLQSPPVGEPSRLLSLMRMSAPGQCCNYLPMPVLNDVRAQTQSFSDVAGYFDLLSAAIGGGNEPEREWGQATTVNYFDVLAAKMAAGRGFTANEDKAPVIVLGYRLWQKKFGGDTNVISIGGIAASGIDYENTYIGGIFGASVNTGTALPVYVDNDGHLGTALVNGSGNKVRLRTAQGTQHQASLNEFQKQQKRIAELENTVARLAATVKEQSAQIEKVSAQLEVRNPAQRVVVNKQ